MLMGTIYHLIIIHAEKKQAGNSYEAAPTGDQADDEAAPAAGDHAEDNDNKVELEPEDKVNH